MVMFSSCLTQFIMYVEVYIGYVDKLIKKCLIQTLIIRSTIYIYEIQPLGIYAMSI